MVNGEAGKGDSYRPVDPGKYAANYERIFGRKKLNNMEDHRDLRQMRRKSKNLRTA